MNRELILPPSPMTVADVQINENKNSARAEVLATAAPAEPLTQRCVCPSSSCPPHPYHEQG